MAPGICELSWLQIFPYELGFIYKGPLALNSDSASVWQFAGNLVLHEHAIHFEVDVHFFIVKIETKGIEVKYVHT